MLEEFKKILNDSKNFLNKYYANKQYSSNDLNLNYYYQVIYEVQYVFQNIVNIGKQNVLSCYFLDFIVLAFEDLTKTTENIKIQDFYYSKIINEIKFMYIYTLLINSNISSIDVRILSRIYKTSLYLENKNSTNIDIKNSNILIFNIIKNIIDSNLNNKNNILISISKNFDTSFIFSNDDVKYKGYLFCNIANLNRLISTYLHFKKDYFLFKEYNSNYSRIFIINMKGIIKYSVDKN